MKKLPKEYYKAVSLAREFFAEQGAKGGKKAAQQMTPAQRTIRAHKAAVARNAKRKGGQK